MSGAGAPPETAAAFDPTRNVPCSVANATDDKVTWYDVNKKTSYWTRDACGCGVAVTLRPLPALWPQSREGAGYFAAMLSSVGQGRRSAGTS